MQGAPEDYPAKIYLYFPALTRKGKYLFAGFLTGR